MTSGGSAAALDAFVAAREAAGHPERATVYMGGQSHSAQARAARIIGIRPGHVRVLQMFWEERAFISSTLLHRKFALRMCVVNHSTTWADVRETLETIERFGREAV